MNRLTTAFSVVRAPARRGLLLALGAVLAACAPRGLTGVNTYTFKAREHREGQLAYAQSPPAGGAHNPIWQTCGVYAAALYPEFAVHSLEHGAVWITYRPSLTPEDVRALANLAAGRTHVLVSPVGRQGAAVVLTAWGAQLGVDGVGDGRIRAFLDRYEQGPGTPERGAPCAGGTAQTL